MSSFENDLREMIRRQHVVTVIGSGVSLATNASAPAWRALIESALERCREIGVPKADCDAISQLLKLVSADLLLAAAEFVDGKLRANGGGELKCWLRETFAGLEPKDPTVIQSLAALGTPVMTTNYDDLIEKVTGLRHVTWKDASNAARVLRGEDRRVLHLHGHWEEAESVVLGIRSYETVLNDRYLQAAMQAFGMTKSFLFVGCGDEGLGDPNFGNFLTWLEAVETAAGVEHRHYRLVRKQDACAAAGRLFSLVYGDDYQDLPKFLERLLPESEAEEGHRGQKKKSDRVRPKLPESIEHYLRRLEHQTQHLSLLGMGRSLQVELPIAEAYIPLRTTLSRSMDLRKTDHCGEGLAEHEENLDLGEIFRKAGELGRARGGPAGRTRFGQDDGRQAAGVAAGQSPVSARRSGAARRHDARSAAVPQPRPFGAGEEERIAHVPGTRDAL